MIQLTLGKGKGKVDLYYRLVNVCGKYRHMRDVAFNISKCQGITFGSYSQSTPVIHLNNRLVPWVSKMKYLELFLLLGIVKLI